MFNWVLFNEGPSDDFKIEIAVWVVDRTTENSGSNVLLEIFQWLVNSEILKILSLLYPAKIRETQLELCFQKHTSGRF